MRERFSCLPIYSQQHRDAVPLLPIAPVFAIILFQSTSVSAATDVELTQSVSPLASPTAFTSASNISQSAGGLDPTILTAIIGLGGVVVGALIVGAFAVYQM